MTLLEGTVIIGGLFVGYVIVGYLIRENKAKDSRDFAYKKKQEDHADVERKEESTTDENVSQEYRIFSCPSCRRKIRAKIPPKADTGKCTKCNSKFHIDIDDHGNLSVTGLNYSEEFVASDLRVNSIDDCFYVLGLLKKASTEEIKMAYRQKMREYHPDKVAHLGEKLRFIADREAKKVNAAYEMLKDSGYLSK